MKKLLSSFLVLVFLAFLLLLGYWKIEKEAYKGTFSPSNVAEQFEVKEGEGSTEVGINLEKAGLIKNKYYFYYFVWKTKTSSKIQAGIYELAPNMTMGEMVSKFTSGEIVPQIVKLTIPEGFTNKKVIDRLREKSPKLADEFALLANCRCINNPSCSNDCDRFSAQYGFIQGLPKGVDLEGYLFPDTYFIEKEDTAEILMLKFLNNFKKQVDPELLTEIEKQGKSLHDVITMASIVEKEANTPEDRRIVAGIFWKRIIDNHPLQSCATLAYVTGIDKKQYSIEDTQYESPYNTYTNLGFPPGPVSNPGLDAIKAAVYPTQTDYYFFLTDPKTGEMVYSKTGAEHAENKLKHGL